MKVGDTVRVLPGVWNDHVPGFWTVTRVCRDDTFDLSRGESWPDCEEWDLNVTRRRLELALACDPCVTFLAYLREWQRRAKPRHDRQPQEKANWCPSEGSVKAYVATTLHQLLID